MAQTTPADAALLEKLLRGQLPPADAERFAAAYADDRALEPLARALAADESLLDAMKKRPPAPVTAGDSQAEKLVRRLVAAVSRRAETVVLPAEAADDGPAGGLAETVAPGGGGDDESEPMPTTLEYFRIEKVLGEGGMGTVYLAEDTRLGRKVAVKTLKKEIAKKPGAKDRFFREARTAAKLEHDHIIPIHYVGESRGVPFLAMPFLKGWPLDAHIMKTKALLPTAEVLRIGREVALGLAAAHEAGLIHRDIKPANIWLEAPHGRVKILDFGLARSQGEEGNLTASGAVMGTPAYMAPEQARGKPVDARADLFSLGVMLYEMATGKKPFTGPDMMSILTSLALDDPAKADEVNPAVPPKLADLIARLMAKEPGRRPMSAAAVADELMHLTMQTTRPTFEALPELPAAAPASGPVAAAADPWGGIEDTELPAVVSHAPKFPAKSKVQPQPKAQLRPAAATRGPNKWLLPVASLLGLAIVTVAVIVIVRDKDGKKIAEIPVPDGGKVEVVEGPKPSPEKISQFKPLPAVELPATSPFDTLDVTKIPAGQKPDWLPKEAVAVFGTVGGKHAVPAHSVDATPDGKLAVTVGFNDSVRLFDVAAGKVLAVLSLSDVRGRVRISADGKKIAVNSQGALKVFAVDGPAVKPFTVVPPPAGDLHDFDLSADGSTAVLTTAAGRAEVWALTNPPTRVTATAESKDRGPEHVVFVTGGSAFATAGADKTVRVWDAATGKPQGQAGPFNSVLVGLHAARDGKDLIWSGNEGDIRRWALDGAGLAATKEINIPLNGTHGGSAVSADGTRIALTMSHSGGTVEVWPLGDAPPALALAVNQVGNPPPVWLAADGKTVLFGANFTQSLAAADVGGGGRPPRLVVPGIRHETPLAVSPAGDIFVNTRNAVGQPKVERFTVVDGAVGPPKADPRFVAEEFLSGLMAVPPGGGRAYALAADNRTYTEYDLTAPPGAPGLTRHAADRSIHRPAVSADESTHVFATADSAWVVLKRGRGPEFTEYARIPVNLMGSPRARLAPDGRAAYIQDSVDSFTGRLRVYDLTGPKPAEVKAPAEWAKMLTFDVSADGRRAAVYGAGALTTWDLTGPAPKIVRRKPIAPDVPFFELLLSPDGRYLLFGGLVPGQAVMCHYTVTDTLDDSAVISFYVPHPVTRRFFTPESRHLVVARGDGTAAILRVAKPPAATPDRKAAEYVLSLGGTVRVNDQGGDIKTAKDLPGGVFRLTGVTALDNDKLTDDALAVFRPCTGLKLVVLAGAPNVGDAGVAHFRQCKDVNVLVLSKTKVTDAGMAFLDDFANLNQVNFNDTLVGDATVARLKKSKALTMVQLDRTKLTDSGLAVLATCPNLQEVLVRGTAVTPAGIAAFRTKRPVCKVWEDGEPADADRKAAEWVVAVGGTLHVNGTEEIGGGEIKAAADLPIKPFRLTRVSLPNNKQLTDGELARFADCKHLKVVDFTGAAVGDEGLRHFKGHENLVYIQLLGTRVTDAGLASFTNCKDLRVLLVDSTKVSDAGLVNFKECRRLTSLMLHNTQVTDVGVALFKDHRDLTEVLLNSTRVTDSTILAVRDLPYLRRLELYGTGVTDAGVDHLKSCRNLRVLNLAKTAVTAAKVQEVRKALPRCAVTWDDGVNSLAESLALDRKTAEWALSVGGQVDVNGEYRGLKALADLPKEPFRLTRVVVLDNPAVGDQDLARLKDCPDLGWFSLRGTPITDIGLANLTGAKNLVEVSLAYTKVTDAGLARLKDCKQMTLLALDGTQVTDAGLAVVNTFPNLRRLTLKKTNVTAAKIEELRKALPNCRIEWDGGVIEPAKK